MIGLAEIDWDAVLKGLAEWFWPITSAVLGIIATVLAKKNGTKNGVVSLLTWAIEIANSAAAKKAVTRNATPAEAAVIQPARAAAQEKMETLAQVSGKDAPKSATAPTALQAAAISAGPPKVGVA